MEDTTEPEAVDAAGTRDVPVAYPYSQYVCPKCQRTIHHKEVRTLGRPPQQQAQLNIVLRCPHCRYFFSPKTTKPVGGLVTLGAEDANVHADGGYTCPGCARSIPQGKARAVHRPPKHADNLNPVIRCPFPDCAYVFSPKPAGRRVKA